jgi:hypothetical protein
VTGLVVLGTSRDCTATRAVLTWVGFMARHLRHGIGPVDDSDGVTRGLFCEACGRGVVFRSRRGQWPPVRVTRVRLPLAALNGADS